MTIALAAYGLTCIRGGSDAGRIVFQDVCLSLRAGDAMLLQGPNGSGKTTLLRMMAGLMMPTTGRIQWYGRDTSSSFRGRAEQRLRVHFMAAGTKDGNRPQHSVLQNATFWAGMFHPRSDTSMVIPVLQQVGLEDDLDTPTSQLSLGMRRRLAMARLLAVPRPLWLLDEPTGGLDVPSVEMFERLVQCHRNHGGIALIASHSNFRMEEAVSLKFDGIRRYTSDFTV